MTSLFSRLQDRSAVIVLGILICFLFWQSVRQIPVIADPGDTAYKARQVRDFIDSGFSSFSIRYPGVNLDKDYSFFPGGYPFVHKTARGRMYVFPFQYSLAVSPFYRAWGLTGFYVLTFLSALIFLIACYFLGRSLDLTPPWNAAFLFLAIMGNGLWVHAFGASEHMLATCLSFGGIALSLPGRRFLPALLGGCLVGVAGWFRPESFVLGGLIFGGAAIFSTGFPDTKLVGRYRGPLGFGIGFSLAIAVWISTNVLITGNALGLRGNEVSGQTVSAWIRVSHGLLALFHRESGGGLLIGTPAFALCFLSLLFFNRLPRLAQYLLLITIPYCLVVPQLLPHGGGYQFGERFLANAYPWLSLCLILMVGAMKKYRTSFAILLTALSLFTATRALNYNRDSLKLRRYIEQVHVEFARVTSNSPVVILRNPTLNTFFLLDPDASRIYFLAESDNQFNQLAKLLIASGNSTNVTVVHSRLRGKVTAPDGQVFNLPEDIVPKGTRFQDLSGDIGNLIVEIRNIRLAPTI